MDLVYVHTAFATSNVYVRWGIPDVVKTTYTSKHNTQVPFKLTIVNGEIILRDNFNNAEIVGIFDMLGRKIVSYREGISKIKYKELSVKNKNVILLIKDNTGNIFKKIVNLL